MTNLNKTKITKGTVPQNFTLTLAIVDALPVIFFSISTILIALSFKSILFTIGACLCVFAGLCKVLWKFIVAIKQKNVWWMFLQMRITMPIGLFLIVLSLILNFKTINFALIFSLITTIPNVIFFALGSLGMICMLAFALALNNANLKSNWIEQATNTFAQLFIMIGILLTI